MDSARLAILHNSAQTAIDERDAQANELKYLEYPSTRPHGWVPAINPDIRTDEDSDDDIDDEDHDGYNALNPGATDAPLSQRFETHLQQSESGTNPALEAMFGNTKLQRLTSRSAMLQNRKPRGRPRKQDKSASGSRLQNGSMSQQINGITLKSGTKNPALNSLKGVAERTGGMVTFGALVAENMVPGRIQVT